MQTQIAEIQLSYHPKEVNPVSITCSRDAYELFLQHWDQDRIALQEEFKLLLLNKANHVLGIVNLSKGGIDGTVVDTRLVLAVVLKAVACSVILAHNHPSGRLHPSTADKELTEQLKQGCTLVGINLLDHLVMSRKGYLSLADEGLL